LVWIAVFAISISSLEKAFLTIKYPWRQKKSVSAASVASLNKRVLALVEPVAVDNIVKGMPLSAC
jgi:hypothetical protein